jgi:S-DNA-T family DNA segregation ATPase FtsK/SpoIIIE
VDAAADGPCKIAWLARRWAFRHRVAVTVTAAQVLFTHRFGLTGLAALLGALTLMTSAGREYTRAH